MAKASFGRIEKLPSGRYRAFYDVTGVRHRAPQTFSRRDAAAKWLAAERLLLDNPDKWAPPTERAAAEKALPTVATYAAAMIEARDLKKRVAEDYRRYLDRFIIPTKLGSTRIDRVTPANVRAWFDAFPSTESMRRLTYGFLKSVFADAVREDLIPANPCRIKGGASYTPKRTPYLPTPEEVRRAMSELPAKYRLMVALMASAALRYGEVAALRREHVTVETDPVTRLRVEVVENLTVVAGRAHIDTPKTKAGVRTVIVGSWIVPMLAEHLAEYAQPDGAGLLFPNTTGGYTPESSWSGVWVRARKRAGLPNLQLHDLRRYAVTYGAGSGVAIAGLAMFAGHSDEAMTRYYQQPMRDALDVIADSIPPLVPMPTAEVIPLERRA